MRLFACLLAAATALLSSCVSSERMTRISPLEQDAAAMSESRVNLWPCYYADQDFQSALWPCFDLDKTGMAVRPFYNQEGKEYSILFPLAAWNPVNGDGWCFNGYWDDKQCGAFPLFHADKDFHYVGPVWWTDKYRGLFPAMCFSGEFNYFGPFYGDFKERYVGMAPLFHADRDDDWFFPLYGYSSEPGRWSAWGLCGLAYLGEGDARSSHWVLPLYLSTRWKEKGEADGELDLFLPAYVRYGQGDASDFATPLCWISEDSVRKDVITPVFSYGWDRRTGDNDMLNALGPCFIWSKGEGRRMLWIMPFYDHQDHGDSSTAFLPLFVWSRGGGNHLLWIMPFYDYQDKTSSSMALMPIWISHADKEKRTWRSCLLFMFRHNAYGTNKTELVAFPLLSVHNDCPALVNVNPGGFNALGWLLFSYEWRDNRDDSILPSSYPVADAQDNLELELKGSTLRSSRFNSLFFNQWNETWRVWVAGKDEPAKKQIKALNFESEAGWEEDKAKKAWLFTRRDAAKKDCVELLTKEGFTPESDRDKDLDKALRAFAAKNTRLVDFNDVLVPFLYRSYVCDGHAKRWWLMYTVQDESAPERDRFSVLWRAYRSERVGQERRTDMFPFVSWSSSPDASRFSFGWRLWSRHGKPGGARGHILFIPWGE